MEGARGSCGLEKVCQSCCLQQTELSWLSIFKKYIIISFKSIYVVLMIFLSVRIFCASTDRSILLPVVRLLYSISISVPMLVVYWYNPTASDLRRMVRFDTTCQNTFKIRRVFLIQSLCISLHCRRSLDFFLLKSEFT